MVRAYADDTALVVEDIWTEGPTIARLFEQFEEISGLRLNLNKCIFIPLSPASHNTTRSLAREHIPQWLQMTISNKGKYLGYYIGPGKGDATWHEPLQKYTKRCNMWSDRPLALQLHTQM